MSGHTIRTATSNDFDAVMSIGQMYDGLDYLRYRYHCFLGDPNATSYVYTINDQVVGFCSAFLLDNGQTLNVRAARVVEAFRDQGVYKKLMDRVRKDFHDTPGFTEELVVMDSVNFDARAQRIRAQYTELYQKKLQHYHLEVQSNKALHAEECSGVAQIHPIEMANLFSNTEFSKSFLNSRILVDWVPLRLLESNMKYILGDDSMALASKQDDGSITLLSIGTPARTRHVLDFIGTDTTLIRNHIVRHLNQAMTVCNCRSIIIQISSPVEGCLFDTIDSIMSSLNLPTFHTQMVEMHVLRKPLK